MVQNIYNRHFLIVKVFGVGFKVMFLWRCEFHEMIIGFW